MEGHTNREEDALAVSCFEGIRSGDRSSLETLFDIYHKPLYSILFKVLGDSADAEEVTQDVFVKIWTSRVEYNPELSRPFSFLVLLGRRMAIDRIRKRRRRQQMVLEEQINLQADQDKDTNFKNAYKDAKLDTDWLLSRGGKLSREQASAIELAYLGGLSQKEIAQKLKRPLGTIKSEIRRGLQRLREVYLEKKDD